MDDKEKRRNIMRDLYKDPKTREKIRQIINKSREKHNHRLQLIDFFGGVCMCDGVNCWHDGYCDVSDYRCLQIEHIDGGGNLESKILGPLFMYRFYINNKLEAMRRIQIFCANCNFIKARIKKESTGRPKIHG